MRRINEVIIGLAISTGFIGGLNYIINSHAMLGQSTDIDMSRPDGIIGGTSYQRISSPDSVADSLVYVVKRGIGGVLFCRDGDFGDGNADGLCDTVCIDKLFSERACFRRNKDYDTHRSEFEKADKLYKDTKRRFRYSLF